MGVDCGAIGNTQHQKEAMEQAEEKLQQAEEKLQKEKLLNGSNGKQRVFGSNGRFHSDPYKNDHKNPLYYQGIAAAPKYER
jgi:hypothetical protein